MSEEVKPELQLKSKKQAQGLQIMGVESKKQVSRLWIINTEGKPSISATFSVIAFFVTSIAYVASIFEGYGELKFRSFDVAACSAYMIPILTLYFGRRWSDMKSKKDI